MMRLFRRATAAPCAVTQPERSPTLARFDTFTAAEVAALPRSLRRVVIADRLVRTTAKLRREIGA